MEGRDLLETIEKAIRFDRDECRWQILGEAAQVHISDERAHILGALEEATEPLSPKEIMLAIGRADRNAIDQLLFKMARVGEVEKVGRGKYVLPKVRIGATVAHQPRDEGVGRRELERFEVDQLPENRPGRDFGLVVDRARRRLGQ